MLKEIVLSIQAYFEAHRFIVKNRLWKWILIPGLIYTILFLLGIYFFWTSSNVAIEWMLAKTGVRTWLNSMHESWLNFFFIVGQVIFRLLLLLFYFSLFKFLFLILGAPVFAYLSELTESILENKSFPFSLTQFLKDIFRAIKLSCINLIWQSVYLISLLVLSFIPVLGWVTPLVVLLIDCFYWGFSMLDYSSERNKLTVSESMDLIHHHRGLAMGNGLVFYMMHFIPVIAPSYAVIAATLSLHQARKTNVLNH